PSPPTAAGCCSGRRSRGRSTRRGRTGHSSRWARRTAIERRPAARMAPMADKMRLDKWLWAARFYKTRSLAAQEIGKGRVLVNDQPAKPARGHAGGDLVSVRTAAPPN